MKRFRLHPAFFLLSVGLLIGCERNPIDRLTNPNPGGALSVTGDTFVLYDDQIKTGGGAGFIPGGENQSISFSNTDSPRRTSRQIKYTWNGGKVFNHETSQLQHQFAGFSLPITSDMDGLIGAQPKNLNFVDPPYTKLKLWIRGSVSSHTTVKIDGPNGSGYTPAFKILGPDDFSLSEWTPVELVDIPSSHFENVLTFVTISFQYDQVHPGLGGTIYVDDIRYERD